MKKNYVCLALSTMLFALCSSAMAQQPKKIPRIGYLSSNEPTRESARFEAIQLALRERGYIEGQNIASDYRYAEGRRGRLPELAAELVRLKVDIIVAAGGDPATQAAMNATKTIPIVLVGGGSGPVEAGYIDSLARPGGNVTGLTTLSRELAGKRLELLKEAVPKVARRGSLRSGRAQCTRAERSSKCGARAAGDYSALGGTSCGRFREGICRVE